MKLTTADAAMVSKATRHKPFNVSVTQTVTALCKKIFVDYINSLQIISISKTKEIYSLLLAPSFSQ